MKIEQIKNHFICHGTTYVTRALFFAAGVFLYYAVIGTDGNIEEIRARAPTEIPERGWEIMRDEGYQYGSFGRHGGYVWYHVRNTNDRSTQYRVKVSLWDGRLEYWYGAPEKLSRTNVDLQ